MAFIRNCWYVIAWDHEIPADALFQRTVIGEPVLLYRTAAGEIVALEDFCVHRLAPLSMGRKEGDAVRCGYHGMLFDATGRCTEIPGAVGIPPKARVRKYPIVVRNKWVFIWMGAPEQADTALLPDNFSCDHPDWRNKPGYLHYDTPYLLICDNLLDFSHLSYVHEKTLGGSTAIAQARAQVEPVPQGVRISRHVSDVPPPPFYAAIRQMPPGNVDRWFVYDFLLPGTLLMSSGGRPVEDAPDDLRRAVQLHSCQTLTPETETSTHYFFQQSHRAEAGSAQVTEGLYRALLAAFEEDRQMITAQARSIAVSNGRPMLPLGFDAGLIPFRRLVEERLAAEAGGA